MNAATTDSLLLIILFPLGAAVFNLLFGRWLVRWNDRVGREAVHLVAVGAVAVSCFLSFSLVQTMVEKDLPRLVQSVYPWIVSGETRVGFDLLLDPLSAVMILVVTGVGLLIHIFSVGYMAKDPDYARYFAYLNLFMASMLILVLGKSLVVTFVGWEGVGLCSYLLIGFWFTDDAKATAGRKAFVMNRIGDFGFILGLFLIYFAIQSLDIDAIRAAAAAGSNSVFVQLAVFGVPLATVATLLLFVGCTGKSAQIPLYTWLPDAMAGPTPVSALIHAATMVTAGVYLIVRLNFLFALAPVTMAIIAVIGAVTALFAATIGITQNDIKKVLAYSTVSQLGYMFLAAGMGAWVAAIFHLVTHAFFKACLFLGSGAVIEACHHEQDIRTMGGLKHKMPVTAATFFVSCLAIAGIFPFAGFFSKDEILVSAYVMESAWSPGINWLTWVLGTVAAACTAFYMFRLYYLVFEGKWRGDHHTWTHHVAEYGIMSAPLVVLAVLAATGGFLGWPHALNFGPIHFDHTLIDWLEPITATAARFSGEYYVGIREEFVHDGHLSAAVEIAFMLVSLSVAIAAILFARSLYKAGDPAKAKAWADKLDGLYRASLEKYWVDEIYDAVIVRPLKFLAQACYRVFDALIVDGLGVGGTAGLVGALGNRVRTWHNGNVRRYLLWLAVGAAIVVASILANPTVSEVGPSAVHRTQNRADMGGLRNTLGAQPYRIRINLGFWDKTIDLGPEPTPGRSEPPLPPQKPLAPTDPSGEGGRP